MVDMPFFMTNESWYYFDITTKRFQLTDKAPELAKKSYEEFYKQIDSK